MKRALRRHQQQVAKVRHLNVVLTGRSAWWKRTYMHDGILCVLWEPQEIRIWRPVNKQVMLTPGSWVHEKINQPSRIKNRRLCHLVACGADSDAIEWPDYKRLPYFW